MKGCKYINLKITVSLTWLEMLIQAEDKEREAYKSILSNWQSFAYMS